MGTGRCGTQSLARLLTRQPATRVSHERRPLLPWDTRQSPHPMANRFLGLAKARLYARHVGDVALFYLPYVEEILHAFPDARVICLRRSRAETVESFVRWMHVCYGVGRVNHWRADRTGLVHSIWDPCFPRYDVETLDEALGLYWDEYYRRAEALVRLYPDNVRIFEMRPALSFPTGIGAVLDWARIPGAGRRVRPVHVHRNRRAP